MESDGLLPAPTPNPLPTRFQPGQSGHPETRFQPGQSGNPQGSRAKCRFKLSEAFIRQLWLDFEEHGAKAIVEVRERRPQDYLKIVASLIPRTEQGNEGRPRIGTVVFVRSDGTEVTPPHDPWRDAIRPESDSDNQRRDD